MTEGKGLKGEHGDLARDISFLAAAWTLKS